MKKSVLYGVVLAAFISVGTTQASIGVLPDGSPYLSDRVVVKLNRDVPELLLEKTPQGSLTCNLESFNRLIEDFGIISIEPFHKGKLKKEPLRRLMSRLFVIHLDNPGATEILPHLQGLPELEFAELQFLPKPLYTPNDPYIDHQWFLEKIRCFEAWDIIRGDTTKIAKVGIVDSGVNWEHPDLEPNLWINRLEDINSNGRFDNFPEWQGGDLNYIDDDGNGYEDDVIGWDFVGWDPDPKEEGHSYHGTAVAGAASPATDNDIGIAGAGFSAKILPVRCGDDYFIYHGYQGITYAAEMGADLINCSWGSHDYSHAEQQIINAAYESGSLVVAAAGANSSPQPVYPAAYEHVTAVLATDEGDHKAYFSDYGDWIDICAPGVNIYTTWGENGYSYLSGTSLASPVAAGVALLVKTQNPHFTPDSLEYRLKLTAVNIDSLNPGYQGLLGAGRVDAYLALFPFEITLVPEDTVIVIPPEGGSFRFFGRVYNPIRIARRFDAWSVVVPPRPDTVIGPMELVEGWPIPASDSVGKSFRQSVPGWAPSGVFTYIGFVGDYPHSKLDSSYFTFEKLEGFAKGGIHNSWELLASQVNDKLTSLPSEFSLSQNHPNPFNASTTICYQLPVTSHVRLEIYDLLGRKVATLVNQRQEAGSKAVIWEASWLSSGIYFYKLTTREVSESKRMLLLK